ncbi:16S rRNA (uracil(1498)-N(3))-methyltransferase [Sphingomonas sp. CGMCC 1.13654]|uniref:Ribosomal RNA small subunit methyltransferase E n=1 Tax=Sphingomonas chungangi TaxID=2683589 RepID=A0A838LBG3_9SPHN|nr:16S rRNA (uracil(1498)-N(3))-methyltransferase [Sphingomonas chungangi]MBA2936581.1 16S rRNA (uracil(1498)-N(3))-methyltransferase [Sphingomonas chungangi]MVW55966.1 16S rRNA (uracil(1498)-N(3))-methyltransferase [Sphingomonas chungangi]
MPATPTWPPESAPRLFIDQPLSEGAQVTLDSAQANYLINVMRLRAGDAVRCFDDKSGEWAAELSSSGKRDARLQMVTHLAPREPVPDFWMVVAPIKRQRIDWMAEKACELGVDRFVPVLTRRSVVDKLNLDRLRTHMIEAAEQCGRTALPALDEPVKLERLLRDWPADRTLYFADETGGERFTPQPGPAAILIGPEGGFDPQERDAIRAHPQARGISLGPRILRAETAALAAAAVWMSAAGDW